MSTDHEDKTRVRAKDTWTEGEKAGKEKQESEELVAEKETCS